MSLDLEADVDTVLDETDEDPIAAALKGARMAMVVTDRRIADNPIVFANDAFLALTGYRREEVLGRNCRFLQGPDTDRAAVARLRQAIEAGREVAVELLNYRKDGTPFWNGVFVSPVTDPSGEVIYYFGSLFDVTARKDREFGLARDRSRLADLVQAQDKDLRHTTAHKTVLLHEVEHRVKNNLQLVSSLLQFQARRTGDPHVRAALQEVHERVSALSTVHRRMFRSGDPGRFDVAQALRDIVEDAAARNGRRDIRFELDVEAMEAPASEAAPFALLINEVLGHGLRHGFPEGRAGRVAIRARRNGALFRIEISDDSALTSGETRAALAGPAGIVEVLRRQLKADIAWGDNFPGLQVTIDLPVEPGAERPSPALVEAAEPRP